VLCDALLVPSLQQDAQTAVRNGVKKDSLGEARDYINTVLRLKTVKNCPQPPAGEIPSTPAMPPASQQLGGDCGTPTSGGGH
jgi:protein phosphatase